MKAWWQNTLFESRDAVSINLFRFLYCALVAVQIGRYTTTIDNVYSLLAYYPVPSFHALGIGLLPAETLKWVAGLTLVAVTLASLGVFARFTLTLSWLGYYIFFGTMMGFTKEQATPFVSHSLNIAVFVLMVLSVTPSIDRWRVTHVLRKRAWVPAPDRPATIPQWPYISIIALLAFAYFGAGYTKLADSGLSWVDGATMQGYLLTKYLLTDNPIPLILANQWLFCFVLGGITLLFELTFPLVIYFKKARWVYVPMGIAFHLGILLVMNINFFRVFVPVYLIFINIPWLGKRLGKVTESPQKNLQKPSLLGELVFIYIVGMMLACALFRVEFWPLTDYRVFSNRSQPEKILVLRLAGETADGERTWLTKAEVHHQMVTLRKRLRLPIYTKNYREARQILDAVGKHLPPESKARYKKLVIVARRIEKTPERKFVAKDQPILRYDL